jgi:hypothetical protein
VRALALAALLSLSLAACAPHHFHTPSAPDERAIRIDARALPLNPADPKQDRVGAFVFAGALQLASPDTALFGGLSDLKVSDDGVLTAVSDEGSLLRAHIVLDDAGRLVGLDRGRIALLTGQDGRPLPNKNEADAEGLAVWPNGELMVSFEHDHRIWIYPAGGGQPRPAPRPGGRMPKNSGMEALALAPAEGADAYWVGVEAGQIWLCRRSGGCQPAHGQFPAPLGYRLPALFEMANGDLVIEHHHWDPVGGTHVIISVIGNPATKAGPALKARLRLDPPLTIDNIEGVAVVDRAGGAHRLYLISDDNFARTQKTLLMAFDFKGEGGAQ